MPSSTDVNSSRNWAEIGIAVGLYVAQGTPEARALLKTFEQDVQKYHRELSQMVLAAGQHITPADGTEVERERAREIWDAVPPLAGHGNRDTSVVVSSLFRDAVESVLVAGYAVYQGKKVFHDLAERMVERPALKVQMFLDIQRRPGDTSTSSELVRRFAHRFQTEEWPVGIRCPEVFYDPRALSLGQSKRTALHAKCVVADSEHVFVSSANFTEAAQERNVEVGLLVHSTSVASRLTHFFGTLAASGQFLRAL